MLVNYFEITDCVPDNINGVPVLIAPAGTPEKLLRKRGFGPLADGREARTLTAEENDYLQSNSHLERAVIGGTKQKTKPGAHCIVAMVLLVVSIIAAKHAIISFPLALAALILCIYTRVHQPENTWAKALLTVCIVWVAIDTVLFIVLSIVAAACSAGTNAAIDALSECRNCSG